MSVAWIYPPRISGWLGLTNFSFGSGIDKEDMPPELRTLLERWAGQFSDDEFARKTSPKDMTTWSVDYEAAARNIEVLERRLANVLSELKSL